MLNSFAASKVHSGLGDQIDGLNIFTRCFVVAGHFNCVRLFVCLRVQSA